ncbi:MAG: response regulator transcription factor [Burkholderiales bacterium]|nr:response regulator transcription factor [Burkholderiales bacterium]
MDRKLHILIADDEELARRLSKEFLRCHADLEIVAECDNGIDAVDAITRLNPDLILLDIQMPKLSGLEVLQTTGRRSGVIFTTAYDQFALKAFDLHAVDYLLKPFSQQRFNDALEKARKLLGSGEEKQTQVQAVNALIGADYDKTQRLLIRDRGQVHVVSVQNIEFIEAQDDYIVIHSGGKKFMKTQSLSELEMQLNPEKFVRIHRSYLLHIDALKSIERSSKDSHVATLHNGSQIPVSRSGYERIRSFLG